MTCVQLFGRLCVTSDRLKHCRGINVWSFPRSTVEIVYPEGQLKPEPTRVRATGVAFSRRPHNAHQRATANGCKIFEGSEKLEMFSSAVLWVMMLERIGNRSVTLVPRITFHVMEP
jgi:hypothetical protein